MSHRGKEIEKRPLTDSDSDSGPAPKGAKKAEEEFICVDEAEGVFKGFKKMIHIEGQMYVDIRGVNQYVQVKWKKKGPKLIKLIAFSFSVVE